MSEAWREAARLGKKGEEYPHILVDSHGWHLRLGPQGTEDNKYYSPPSRACSKGSMSTFFAGRIMRARGEYSK